MLHCFRVQVPGRSAPEGEFEIYEAFSSQLRSFGCHVGETLPMDLVTPVGSFTLKVGPRIVISPDFAVSNAQLRSKFPEVRRTW